jgi:hypothetical protein
MNSKERLCDIMRQGFNKPRRERAPAVAKPQVACDECQNWHVKGKHTATPGYRAEQRREKAFATTFCADILVPDAHEPYASQGGRCVMTGCHSTLEHVTRDKAFESAGYYVEPSGYPTARIVIHAMCGKCGGSGQLAKNARGRRWYNHHQCDACVGAGTLYSMIDRPERKNEVFAIMTSEGVSHE